MFIRLNFVLVTICFFAEAQTPNRVVNTKEKMADKIIFVGGSGFNRTFINYVAKLTGKPDPKVCYVPTATGDSPITINNWYAACEDLPLRPYVLRTYIASPTAPKSFEEIILSMDAIIVGGGNTLNMLAIWKAQGIDVALKKAYDQGIILSGGSAGSLCWFLGGSTDSRPKQLTVVEGLGFLKYSHSPHYLRETSRRPLYQDLIMSNTLPAGYACDDLAGLLFVNGEMKKSVTQDAGHKNYFVSVKNGKIHEEVLPAELIE